MKTLRARTDIPIYGYHLTFIVCDDVPEACQKFCPSAKSGQDDEPCKGSSILIELDAYIVINRIHLTPNTVSHETDHVVHAIMRDIGMQECFGSEEAYAYLTGWITGWIYETLRDKKIRLRYRDGKEA